MAKAAGISIHAVDVSTGRIAEGLPVVLRRLEPDPAILASGMIGLNGLLAHPSASGEGVTEGLYEVTFNLGYYFLSTGREAPFLDQVPFRFHLRAVEEHYHLPFKFTPFGFSLFRGA